MNKNIFSMVGVSKLNSFLQTIGALGIIASLIFVGMELRQSQKIALASQQQARSEVFVRQVEFFTENNVDFDEWIRFGVNDQNRKIITALKHMLWWVYNNDFIQYESGLMKESLFKAKLKSGLGRNYNGKNREECILSKSVWKERKKGFDPDFVKFVESLPNTCAALME